MGFLILSDREQGRPKKYFSSSDAGITAIATTPTAPTTTLLNNLIAYWRLDEASGSRYDATGRGNNLVDNNTVGQATALVAGNAADFIAANSEYLSLADNDDLSVNNQDFTFAIWLKFKSLSSDAGFLSKYNFGNNQRSYGLVYDRSSSKLSFYLSPNGTFESLSRVNSDITINQKYLIICRHRQGQNISLQINNAAEITTNHTTGVHNSTAPFTLGCLFNNSPTQFADAVMDGVGFWKRVLTSAESDELWNGGAGKEHPFTITPTSGDPYFSSVVLLCHFDGENNSVAFTDVKGHVIAVNGNAIISTAQSKFGGASGYFDGTGDYLQIPFSSDFEFGSGDLTWECWVRPAIVTPGVYMCILGNALGGASGNAGLFLTIYNSRFIFRHWLNGSTNATSSQTITPNTWYHVVGIKTGTILKIYVDGTKGTDGSTTLTIKDNPFVIGRVPGNAGFAQDFFGYIDEIRITRAARYTENFTPPSTLFPDS